MCLSVSRCDTPAPHSRENTTCPLWTADIGKGNGTLNVLGTPSELRYDSWSLTCKDVLTSVGHRENLSVGYRGKPYVGAQINFLWGCKGGGGLMYIWVIAPQEYLTENPTFYGECIFYLTFLKVPGYAGDTTPSYRTLPMKMSCKRRRGAGFKNK